MDNLYEIVKEIHKENLIKEKKNECLVLTSAKHEFNLFSINCRAENIIPTFENWLIYSKKNILDVHIRKSIAEIYFNKKFIFNINSQSWNIVNSEE